MENTFKKLGISSPYLTALAENNIETPSEIQLKTIPILLKQNTDFIGLAQTGTGKTLAFSLPILEKVDAENSAIQALILAPTRELCQQIAKQIFRMTKHQKGIFVTAVFGGEKIEIQQSKLSKPTQIVVATPGRLLDLLERGSLNLDQVKTLVLDEADEMISMGFKQEIDAILKKLNEQCFTWLFSATMSEEIKNIVSNYLSEDAVTIQVQKKDLINRGIEHQYYVCPEHLKFQYLVEFLKTQPKKSGIIFCKTKAATNLLNKQLIAKNLLSEALHGDLEQRERDKVMRKFKSHQFLLLVTTDISARGIDIDDLNFVVHYQLPDQLEYYTHRSGRTARAGKRGISIAFVDAKEVRRIRMIESQLNLKFEKI